MTEHTCHCKGGSDFCYYCGKDLSVSSELKVSSPFKISSSCDESHWKENRWGERDSDKWPEGFPKPRTCSFCGGVNADGLIELAKLGWTCEMSTKSYKSYWHPPQGQVGPIPPVKFYSNHCTKEQADMLNAAIKQWKEKT